MGLNDRISSVRAPRSRDRVDDVRPAPVAADCRRRRGERLVEAEVASVYAMAGWRDPRCNQVSAAARPDHWDVTYDCRSPEHHVPSMTPSDRTVTVNRQGEPRQ